jgi:hypothetical protein
MMKWFFVLSMLLLLAFPASLPAQIPNAGFETWIGTNPEVPQNWYTNNIPGVPPYVAAVTTISKVGTAHTGTYAAQGSVASYMNIVSYGPVLQTYFGYTGRPASLTGYYNFVSASHDSFMVVTWLYSNSLSQLVATGVLGLGPNGTGYTKFTVPLEYLPGSLAPDSAWIELTVGPGDNDSLHVGSVFLVDDLAFEGSATGIASTPTTPTTYALDQNYPNPFNPSTLIRFELPEASRVRLAVYNLLGEQVALLVNEQRPAGVYEQRFDAAGLASGVYFYRMEAQSTSGGQPRNFVQVRKMTVVR